MSLNLSCTSLLRHAPSRSVRSVCIRPKTDIQRSCNSTGEIFSFQTRSDSTQPGHNRRLSRGLRARETLTRVSHLVVWPLRKHCNGVIWRQPARSPWHLSPSPHSHRHMIEKMTTVVMKLSYRQLKFASLTGWQGGQDCLITLNSNSQFPRSRLVAKRSSGFVAPRDDRVSQGECLRVFLSARRAWCDDCSTCSGFCEDSRWEA